MVHKIGTLVPRVREAAFIAWNAEVAGDVVLGKDVTIWFGASVRGDIASIRIGEGSNVQDNATVHVDTDRPATIGRNVTVGHNAVIHGCTIGDGCLIGMGAIVLTGAEIGADSLVGAGALVTEGKNFPARSLIIGSPAKAVRTLTDADLLKMKENAASYVVHGKEAAVGYEEIREGGAGDIIQA